MIRIALFIACCACQLGCSQRPDSNSSSTGGLVVIVTDPIGDAKVTLSQKQAKWFVQDISGPGVRSIISEYPAAPHAKFEYNGKEYLMHGNAVIHVQEDGKEYLWTGPYLQALISEGWEIQDSIERVEKRADLKNVKMDAPGAYPGGGPAPLLDDRS